ncbi:MAG: hypothetical protein J5970_00990 [Bacilli bacterium]|nr:hypothetical protein [Bacilli bacterium]
MEKKKLEKFKNTNLYNLSNNTYGYLKELKEDDRVIIQKDFDFDSYKESVRMNLSEYSYNFVSLVTIDSEETREIVRKKAKLKNYIDEILDDEDLLNNFTVYKIQQFINRVAKNLLENEYGNFINVSKDDKYLVYKDMNIDMSNFIGFVSADNVISYLYKEFNIKRLKSQDYEEAFVLKYAAEIRQDEDYLYRINQLLFKAGINMDEKGHIVINHPYRDDERVMGSLRDGFVAERKPKRIVKTKKIIDDNEEDFLEELHNF